MPGPDTAYPRPLAATAASKKGWTLLSDPLARNGLALVSSAALSAILGLAYWVLAARLYPMEVVGINAVMINSMIALANLGQLNLGNFLTRTLAGTGPQAGRIVVISYTLATVSGAVFGTAFVLLSQWLAPELSSALSSLWIAVGYAFCVTVWTIFNLQDSVLSGLRQSVWVPVENGAFSVAKLVLLGLFADSQLGLFGPFLAWILPTFLLIPIVNFFVAFRFVPGTARLPVTQRPTVGQVAGMMGWDYMATIAMMIGLGVAPILVLQLGGASAAAGYSITWAITYSIYLVARAFGISMMAEAAADPVLRKSLAARSLALVTGLLVLAALGIVVLAPHILLIFGKDYTGDNITLLRLLVLSAVPWGLTTIYISLARSTGKTGRIAIIQIATMGLFFLATAILFRIYGVIGIGFAWLASHSLVLASVGIVEIRKDRWRLVELLLVTVSAAARLLSQLRPKGQKSGAGLAPSQASAAAEVMAEPPGGLIVRRVTTFDNDCETLKIEGANATNCVYLKRATTPQGLAALARHVETIARLREDIANIPQSKLLPEILFDGRGAGSNFIIQRSVAGIDGREFLRDRPDRPDLLARASDIMAAIHTAGSREILIDKNWLLQWVDEPLSKIVSVSSLWLPPKRKAAALERMREDQHRYWLGRRVHLGWHHGDFSPGNVFFENSTEPGASGHVSAIIDWDGAEDNGPAAVDAWNLALTAESDRRDEEFGFVVRDLICRRGPAFGFRPDRDLAACGDPPEIFGVLAWLQHVKNNLNKSETYRKNPIWRLNNIEWVLEGFLQAGTSRSAP